MKTYRFVVTAHQDVVAETLDKAIETFSTMRHATVSPRIVTVDRIEVRDQKGGFRPLDPPLRAKYLFENKQAEIRLSA